MNDIIIIHQLWISCENENNTSVLFADNKPNYQEIFSKRKNIVLSQLLSRVQKDSKINPDLRL